MSDDFAMRSVEEALDRANTVFELKQRIAALEANVRAAEQFRLQAREELSARDEALAGYAETNGKLRRCLAELLEDNSKMRKVRDTLGEITERWWFRAFASRSLKAWIANALR